MRIVVHREIPDDAKLRRQWNGLVQEMARPEVFYTHQWALAASRAFGKSLSPFLVLAYEAEKLAGVAALAVDSILNTAGFLCATSADYCDLLGALVSRGQFLDAVLKEVGQLEVRSLVLTSVPADSPTIGMLGAMASQHGYYYFQRPTGVCAQVELGQLEERTQLKTTLRKKKVFRYNMNVLGREGSVTFSHMRSWAEIEPNLANFSTAHVARFLAMGRISNIARAERRAFLGELAQLLAEPGWVVLSRMQVGIRSIAWNYGFRFQDSWFWYQPTFDTEYERLSPGYCLLTEIVTEACDQAELRLVDLGLGAEGYKERFANSARTTLHLHLTKSLILHTREKVRFQAARAVKSAPVLESAVRRVGAFFQEARQAIQRRGVFAGAAQIGKHLAARLSQREDLIFYRWPDARVPKPLPIQMDLRSIDLETLAKAAMIYENEQETLSYLLRSASRLQSKGGHGFVLLDADLIPVHFCWVSDFGGLELKELKPRMPPSVANAAIVFDCWTPQSQRGRGYYGTAATLVAQAVAEDGKEPWIFTVKTDHAARKEIETAGFERHTP